MIRTLTLADWLREHPGVQVVCRDRAGAYAEGARRGAPEAVQVADRWHLWHNLAGAVETTVTRHRGELSEPEPHDNEQTIDTDDTRRGTTAAELPENRLAIRTRERYATIQDLSAQGEPISAISRRLGLDRKTVRRFTETTGIEQLLGEARSRASLLDPHKPALRSEGVSGRVT